MYSFYWSRYLEGFRTTKGVDAINGIRAFLAKGDCHDEHWCAKDDINPTQQEIAHAELYSKHHIAIYQRIYTIEQIKESLSRANTPLQVVFPMYESFEEATEYGLVPMPGEDEEILCMHAAIISGYTDSKRVMTSPAGNIQGRGFLTFRNSYGEEWGDHGDGYFSYEFFEERCQEAFMIIPLAREIINKKTVERFSYVVQKGKVYCRIYHAESHLSWVNSFIHIFAYLNDRPIGWIIGVQKLNADIEIVDFFVWPDFRGQGLGTAIMERFINYCRGKTKLIEGWLGYGDARWDGTHIIAGYYEKFGFSFSEDMKTYKWARGKFSLDLQSEAN